MVAAEAATRDRPQRGNFSRGRILGVLNFFAACLFAFFLVLDAAGDFCQFCQYRSNKNL